MKLGNDEFFTELCEKVFFGNIADLSKNGVGNFVVQSLLSSVRNKSHGEILAREILPCFNELMQGGKQGVIWRLTQVAAKFRIAQESIHKRISDYFSKGSKLGLSECIPKLINFSPAEKEGGRITVNANGCKIVLNLLRFVPRLCEPILDGILNYYSGEELTMLAKDSLGSRW